MKKVYKYILSTFLVCSLIISCSEEKFIDVSNPNNLTEQQAIEGLNNNIADQLVSGAYSDMQAVGLYGRYGFFLADHTSDEMKVSTNSNNLAINEVQTYTLTSLSESLNAYYGTIYRGIFKANFAINVMTKSKSKDIDPDVKIRLIAEAKFIRAHYYFLLVTRFGGVPIEDGTEGLRPRSSEKQVYEEIIKDLKFATKNLPPKNEASVGRPSSGSAYALLGKTYLFTVQEPGAPAESQKYQNAYDALKMVEGQGYRLVDNYIDNVNESGEYNDESLFEVGFLLPDSGTSKDAWGTGAGDNETTFISADYSGWGNARPSMKMLEAYEADGLVIANNGNKVTVNDRSQVDPRFFDTFFVNGEPFGKSGWIWGEIEDQNAYRNQSGGFDAPLSGFIVSRKYSRLNDEDFHFTAESGVNPRLLRYAEVLLLKAEAALFKNSPNMQEAIDLMNEVRARPSVNMPPYNGTDIRDYPVTNISEVFEALKHERQIELALEGKRILDLYRWGDALEALRDVKPNYTNESRYFPIPQEQLDTNPLIDPTNPAPDYFPEDN
ncbi:RagB/SusD family nutrient uptake outer membrane protein [Joostella atrarenae]|uniref:RagB/SusD family nutrient uptake outer membrane protein n=1 Tax=Joostella atrarenae TaxID=679257 RepID=A0ABS9J2Q5_9FLAO|nr:RagB/SusD family nutrient uptake outer membrane protein [Joostella atrarenae]MCF8714693.1 RagB/SusD family nutrient uptake outer membrane protein [Joostella atrarenae]